MNGFCPPRRRSAAGDLVDRSARERRFGRRVPSAVEAGPARSSTLHDDLRLFAATFAAGFLFVSVLII